MFSNACIFIDLCQAVILATRESVAVDCVADVAAVAGAAAGAVIEHEGGTPEEVSVVG